MKLFPIAILAFAMLTASCGGHKAGSDSTEFIADSAGRADSVLADSVPSDTTGVVETVVPKAADELFDDFIFNFAANKRLQLSRIVFPLPLFVGDRQETISKRQWKMDYFFMTQRYYTLLFDSEQQMEIVKDTAVSRAVVERISFVSDSIRQYDFSRRNGVWMLRAMRVIPISQSPDASFLEFYRHFASSPEYQAESLNETIRFVGPDPDDDFGQMEGVITPDTWEAFAPELPAKEIYNIIYGEPQKEGNYKVFVLRGIANGMEVEMSFKRIGGKWKLMKLIT